MTWSRIGMRGSILMLVGVFTLGLFFASPALAVKAECPPDSVQVGPLCVDKYEASVWSIPFINPFTLKSNDKLISEVQEGEADLDDLTAGGAIQRHLWQRYGLWD